MSEDDEEVDSIKKKKMGEQQQLIEARKAEEQLKATLRMMLDVAAYDRITNVKLANQQLFLVTAQNILTIYKRIGRKISDEELLQILQQLKNRTERKTSITFERK